MRKDKLKIRFHNPNKNHELEKTIMEICIEASIVKLESKLKKITSEKLHIDNYIHIWYNKDITERL